MLKPDRFTHPATLMVQGCTSDAGKTVMVAGLGRLLRRHGINVAPFKPQNMALNSAVTENGGEIGRAQYLQAQACRVKPSVHFNPVLLKPSSDTGAQVIIHGKAITAMEAAAYHDYKRTAMEAVLESHAYLLEKYQAIVVEGAGSPAEINLRAGDIANMGFAEAVDCPVILVADIDRGGVFAHLLGTLSLLSKSEQSRVIGFIINRFRGDISLLQNGLDWLEKRTGKPVLGVIPYLHDFYLDAEDAIPRHQLETDSSSLTVVVPVLPRISNHTDFDALRLNQHVDLKFAPLSQTNIHADLIILPGSKNVIDDLQALKDHGWVEKINRHLRYGGRLMGICGGHQMLGEIIVDQNGIENEGVGREVAGLGLLPQTTHLESEKQLTQTSGFLHLPSQKVVPINGYEIHCGQTTGATDYLIELKDGGSDGAISDDNQILGTYVHGLFDTAEAANSLLSWAGMSHDTCIDLNTLREAQLERLADTLENELDSEFIDQLIASMVSREQENACG